MSDIRSHSKSRRINREILGPKGSKPCHWCGTPATEVDHLFPVARGGRHVKGNLVPSCRHCNASKGARSTPRRAAPRSYGGRSLVAGAPKPLTYCRHTHTGRRRTTLRADYSRQAAE